MGKMMVGNFSVLVLPPNTWNFLPLFKVYIFNVCTILVKSEDDLGRIHINNYMKAIIPCIISICQGKNAYNTLILT